MGTEQVMDIIHGTNLAPDLKEVAGKVLSGERLGYNEGLLLFEKGELAFLAFLADQVRKRINGDLVYYNRNIHIEPTNICVYNCRFCSYSHHQSTETWEYSIDEMVEKVRGVDEKITEIHIVGAVHPGRDINYYAELISSIRKIKPGIHIKAFTAIEIEYMSQRSGLSIEAGLELLKNAGLDSIPGGGAEIFDEEIREKICGKKSSSKAWLEVHEKAHQTGIPSNCTILYGHIENYSHRIDHLSRLRDLQDRTRGFNAFIPLKFLSKNNEMSSVGEVSVVEDLKNYAVSRIFLDNIPHIKAYWPMIGKQLAMLTLSFGVDDLDGTINDSTKIYSLAGAGENNPSMTVTEIKELIKNAGRIPVERDSIYNILEIG